MTDATISALATTTATEGGYAVARYSLSSALGVATTVRVTVSGLGGATSLDYGGFQYAMGPENGDWQSATSGGLITLNAGFTDFQLRVLVATDSLSEAGEALAFSVARTTDSVGLADSWWVPSTVNLADPAGQGASANLRAIAAVSTSTGFEPSSAGVANANNVNHNAVATYNVNHFSGTGSNGDSVVRVSLYGLGGATGADYDGFSYKRPGDADWIPIANNGEMTIRSTDNSFQLSANVLYDAVTESNEAISFNVAQTSSSIGLVDSWWVPSTVNLADAGAPANLRAITAASTTTALEPSSAGVANANNVNHNAVATYNVNHFSGTGSNGDSVVRVSLYGLGGATGADYDGFSYKRPGDADWIPIANNGEMTIRSTDNSFQLSANVLYDGLSESGEAISFNVAQTTASIGLADSWWVPSTVNLADAAGQGASAVLRTITAASTATASEPSSAGVANVNNVNHTAVATYSLAYSSGSGSYGDSVVRVSLYGLGGATAADYDGFSYKRPGDADWIPIANNGEMTIRSTDNSFQLSANVLYDGLSESGEGISFNVARTTASIGLADSWWVPNTVNLADAAGQGASAMLRTIVAASTTTAIEASSVGNVSNHAAVANYTLNYASGSGSYGDSVVRVSLYGLGGATAADYDGFSYKRPGDADWIPIANNGEMTIRSTDNSFQLSANVLYDGLSESGEGISFNVARTTSSVGLADSWSVPSTVNLADSDPAHNVFTSALGRDHLSGTGSPAIFVIPAGTSVTNNSVGATGVFAGDINNFFGTDYDTITGFNQVADKIDLPSGVNVTLVTSGTVWGGSEETLLDLYSRPSDAAFANFFGADNAEAGSDAIVWRLGSTTTYFLFVDSNNNEHWDSSYDVFIKLVGNPPPLATTNFI